MELALDIHGLSRHLNSEAGIAAQGKQINAINRFNEKNPGVGLSLQWGDKIRKGIIGGIYQNSLRKQSKYIGGEIRRRFGKKAYIDLGLRGGLVTGYGSVKPMIVPLLGLGYKGSELNLMYAPKIEGVTPTTWMLSTRYKLKNDKRLK